MNCAGRTAAQARVIPANDSMVLVIEDDAPVRESIVMLLERVGFQAHGFATAGEFFERAPAAEHACVVTDMRLGTAHGAEVIRRLQASGRAWPAIAISGCTEAPMVVQAIRSGAIDFIEKPFDPARLVESIRGGLTAARRGAVADNAEEVRRRFEGLSQPQRGLFGELAAGCSNAEIGLAHDIDVRDVEQLRAAIMAQMQAESLADLVRMALALQEHAGSDGSLDAA